MEVGIVIKKECDGCGKRIFGDNVNEVNTVTFWRKRYDTSACFDVCIECYKKACKAMEDALGMPK
jgi:hypothetical protein